MSIDGHNALAGPSNVDHKSEHARSPRRIFIGPMPYIPERDIAKEEQISDFAAMHGLRIFLQQGGRIEEWTEARAREYKQRLKERITESTAWYTRARAARKRTKVLFQTEWRGDTFEIGKLAGVSVNMLAEYDDEGLSPRIEDPYTSAGKSTNTMAVHWDESTKPSSHSAASRSKSALGVNSSGRLANDTREAAMSGEGSDPVTVVLLLCPGQYILPQGFSSRCYHIG